LHPLRNILNGILWNRKGDLRDYTITYIHRGAVGDIRKIPFTTIKKVGKSWFLLQKAGDETLIPFHRVVTVENTRTGEVLWRKR